MKICFIILFLSSGLFCFSQEKKDSIQPLSPCVSEIFVPNAFTGNGDGVNDYLIPRLAGIPATYSFTIFNRWGEVIFETDKLEVGWNGSFNDKKLSSDVYIWIIKFTCKDSEKKI